MALIDLNELLDEGLNSCLWRSSCVLNNTDTPCTNGTLIIVDGELAATAAKLATSDWKRGKGIHRTRDAIVLQPYPGA